MSARRVLAPALSANMVRISSFLRGFVVMYGAALMILFGSVSSLYSPVVFHTVLSSLACWLRESFISQSVGKASSSSVVRFPSHFPLPHTSLMCSFTSSVQGVPLRMASLRTCGKIFPCYELSRALSAIFTFLICSSDFIVCQPRSSYSVWFAGACEVCKIFLPSLRSILFMSDLSLSISSSLQASVPYRKTERVHAFAMCICFSIGRFGSC